MRPFTHRTSREVLRRCCVVLSHSNISAVIHSSCGWWWVLLVAVIAPESLSLRLANLHVTWMCPMLEHVLEFNVLCSARPSFAAVSAAACSHSTRSAQGGQRWHSCHASLCLLFSQCLLILCVVVAVLSSTKSEMHQPLAHVELGLEKMADVNHMKMHFNPQWREVIG
jgi:hypothetical protein